MGIVTVRPDFLVDTDLDATVVPSGSARATVVSDDLDSSYLNSSGGVGTWDEFSFPSPVGPVGSKPRRVRHRVRLYRGSTETISNKLLIALYASGVLTDDWQYTETSYQVVETKTGIWFATDDKGVLWTQNLLSDIVMGVQMLSVWRCIELYLDIDYNERPAATAAEPTGTVTSTTRPTLVHTYSDPEGDAQSNVQWKVFTQAQFQAAGFDPEVSSAAWDSGKVATTGTIMQVGADLSNGIHRAYVRAWQVDVDSATNHSSLWTYVEWTQNAPVPAAPTFTLAAEPADARMRIDMQGRDNLLTYNQSSLVTDTAGWEVWPDNLLTDDETSIEGDTVQWTALTRTVISRDATRGNHGIASLLLKSTEAGDVGAYTTRRVPVGSNTQYTAQATTWPGAANRSFRVSIRWYDSGGALLSTVLGTSVIQVASAWTQASVTATSPATAASAEVMVEVLRPTTDNLFTVLESSFEGTDPIPYTLGTNTASLGRGGAGYPGGADGSASFGFEAVNAGDINVYTTRFIPAKPSQQYTALASFYSSASRSVRVDILWYTSAQAFISATNGATASSSTTAWTQRSNTATSPSNTAYARVRAYVIGGAASENHWIDKVSLREGASTTWEIGKADESNWADVMMLRPAAIPYITTITRSTEQSSHEAASLKLKAAAAGDMDARTDYITVAPDELYSVQAEFRAAVTARSVQVMVNWYTAANVYISTNAPAAVSDTTTGWTRSSTTATSPTTAAKARVIVKTIGAALGEVHYVDRIAIAPQALITWSPGGYSNNQLVVDYSDDDGVTWIRHPRMGGVHSGSAQQLLTNYDYEVPAGRVRQYRALSTTGGANPFTSNPSAVSSSSVVFSGWWVKMPSDSTKNRKIRRGFTWQKRKHDMRVASKDMLGRTNKVVLTGGYAGAEFPLAIVTLTEDEYQDIRYLLRSSATLLLQTPHGRQWYIRPISNIIEQELITGQEGVDPAEVITRFSTDVIEVDAA